MSAAIPVPSQKLKFNVRLGIPPALRTWELRTEGNKTGLRSLDSLPAAREPRGLLGGAGPAGRAPPRLGRARPRGLAQASGADWLSAGIGPPAIGGAGLLAGL